MEQIKKLTKKKVIYDDLLDSFINKLNLIVPTESMEHYGDLSEHDEHILCIKQELIKSIKYYQALIWAVK